MYIKSITLDDFKLYRNYVEILNFDLEFNAITGSNRTGKSNILESICFVLGINLSNVGNYSNKNGDHTEDSALKELLKTDPDTDSLTKVRRKSQASVNKSISVNGDLSADEEIIESLVRSATSKRRPAPRERRKNRISDKKHWNRTLDGHQSWPGRESSPGSTVEAQQR